MANILSKQKSIRKNQERNLRNRQVKSQVKTAIKKARAAILSGDSAFKELVAHVHKQVNVAVSKGVINKNQGARIVSRLDKSLNKSLNKQPTKTAEENAKSSAAKS